MSEAPSKPKKWKRASSVLLIALVIAILIGFAFPGHGPKRLGHHLMSWQQMQQIALGLEVFRREHGGQLPHHLSELLPDYIGSSDILFFQSRYTTTYKPTETASHPELIDIFSSYSFAQLPDKRILVAERPGMWSGSEGTMTYLLLDSQMQPVGTFQSCRVTPEEFRRRLLHQFNQ